MIAVSTLGEFKTYTHTHTLQVKLEERKFLKTKTKIDSKIKPYFVCVCIFKIKKI